MRRASGLSRTEAICRLPRSEREVVPGLIVSSGRLERYKGHDRAIKALPIVRRSIPDATLRILGSGPYESHLRSLIQSLGLQKFVTIEYVHAP